MACSSATRPFFIQAATSGYKNEELRFQACRRLALESTPLLLRVDTRVPTRGRPWASGFVTVLGSMMKLLCRPVKAYSFNRACGTSQSYFHNATPAGTGFAGYPILLDSCVLASSREPIQNFLKVFKILIRRHLLKVLLLMAGSTAPSSKASAKNLALMTGSGC